MSDEVSEILERGVRRGWWNLLDEYLPKIEKSGGTISRQPYEKYGTLRIDVENGNAEVTALLMELENKSSTVCEVCGKTATVKEVNGWYKTICDDCVKE